MRLGSKMESDTEGTLSPMLLEDSSPPDKTKKRAWPRRLQIPLGILIVGLVSAGVFGFVSLADSKDIVNSVAERDRRNIASGCITACYTGTSVGTGVLGVCSTVATALCPLSAGFTCTIAARCGIASGVVRASSAACQLCPEPQASPHLAEKVEALEKLNTEERRQIMTDMARLSAKQIEHMTKKTGLVLGDLRKLGEEMKVHTSQIKKGQMWLGALNALGTVVQTRVAFYNRIKMMTKFESLSAREIETMVSLTGLVREDLSELASDFKQQYEKLIAKNDENSALQMARLELLRKTMTELKANMIYMNQETKDLIRRSSQEVLGSLREVDEGIKSLSTQMNDVRLNLTRTINLGALRAVNQDDLEHYDLISDTFEAMERGTSGTIVYDRKVDAFKEVVNDHWRGAETTYKNFHKMLVGDARLGHDSIFDIDSNFCKSKEYFVFAITQLFQFSITAKAMDGISMDSIKTERFSKMLLEIEEKFITSCGCPQTHSPERINNFLPLVSQPPPKTSVGDFYNHVISNDPISQTDLLKLNLLYRAKPFDFSFGILPTITVQQMEVLNVITYLAKSDNLKSLPLFENQLLCTVGPTRSPSGPPSPCFTASGSVKILVRKEVGNPVDYFDKSYEEYKEGFAANGESWLGLDALHTLTSLKDYKLKIILTDFDTRQYVAFYDLFKVGPEEDGYTLTVGSFNEAESTLGDSMEYHNGMKFSTRDRDQDTAGGDSSVVLGGHCAASRTGGWWWKNCANARLTGQHTDRRREDGFKQIFYWHGGDRGDTADSYKEATMELIPRD